MEQQPIITKPLLEENVVAQLENTHLDNNLTANGELKRSSIKGDRQFLMITLCIYKRHVVILEMKIP